MQMCDGGPRYQLHAVTDRQIRQREGVHYRHFRHHVEAAEQFEKTPQSLAARMKMLFNHFFPEHKARTGGTVR